MAPNGGWADRDSRRAGLGQVGGFDAQKGVTTDYLAIPDCRLEIPTLLNRGESVHQLQRAIHGARVAPHKFRGAFRFNVER